MDNDHRRDDDVCQRRRRRGAYAAVLGAAVGAALAGAMISPAHAVADTTDDAVAAAAAGDVVSDAIGRRPTELFILNSDITAVDDDLGLKFLASPDVQLTDSLLGILPGGATGTDATEVETFLVNDFYGPLATDLGGGSQPIAAAAAGDVVDVANLKQAEEVIFNGDIARIDDDLGLKFLANPEIQFTDSLLGLYPGGAEGTLATEVETFAVNDLFTPVLDALGGGGGMMAF